VTPALAAALCLALAAPPAPAPVMVGSKKFTESVVLAELAAQLVERAGLAAGRRAELGGSRVLWEALLRGDVDAYPEYTGTLTRELLAGEVAADADPEALRAALAARGVVMGAPLGFQDAYAVGLRREVAARLGLDSLSGLANHPGLRLAFSHEFLDRADGWPRLRDRYRLPQRGVRGLDHDLALRALAAGEIDATDLYTTDAEIERDGLVALRDDRGAFPEYQAVLLWRADLERRAPGAAAALRRLEGRIDERAMIAMNARAGLDRVPASRVAAGFLDRAFGPPPDGAPPQEAGLAARLLARTAEHLLLVGVALALAIALALPLGVWAALRPAAGRLILGAVGLVQTIPSLALLVLMIPLLGIGARPAVAALAVYGLLPIVRNVHSGLRGIPPELRESAEALALTRLARLRLVELPLASPSILAGVRTSAVIAVGTATLGALIGAGGYGQPILAGIRLASVPLLLEGAVPAALLALAVEGLFSLVERWLVPRGLRGPSRPAGR